MMNFKFKGLDNLSNKLENISNKENEISKPHSVSFENLLTDEFVCTNTNFKNSDELLFSFGINSVEDFESISQNELDLLTQTHTKFDSWKEMLSSAGTEYYKKYLQL